MSWGRSDDRFPQNRKIVVLSDAAFRLYVTARDYANAEQTDGFLVAAAVPGMTRAPQGAALKRVLAELTTVQAGEQHPLWETVAGGYRIHDFLVYNLSRAENAALRAARNEKKVAGGRARAALAKRSAGRFTSDTPAEAPAADQQPTSSTPASGPASDQLGTSPVPGPVPEPLPESAEADASAPILVPLDDLLAPESADRTIVRPREKQRPCRLPEDFLLTPALRKIATDNGCRDPEVMFAAFSDYWRSRAAGATKLDWVATWRIWARDGHCGNALKACACMKARGAHGQPLSGSMAAVRRVGERILGGAS